MKERDALQEIKDMVRTQVVKNEGEAETSPTFVEIYNAACRGLRGSTANITDYSEATTDTLPKNSESMSLHLSDQPR